MMRVDLSLRSHAEPVQKLLYKPLAKIYLSMNIVGLCADIATMVSSWHAQVLICQQLVLRALYVAIEGTMPNLCITYTVSL